MPEPAQPRPAATTTDRPDRAPAAPRAAHNTRSRRSRWALAAALPVVALAAACSSSSTTGNAGGTTAVKGTTPGTLGINPAFSAFYQPPSPLPAGKPGDIIRSQPLTGTPAGSQGWLVLYHSTGLNGEDIAVSGMVIAPTGTTPGSTPTGSTPGTVPAAGARPIVSWAHPTTGVADNCAPSAMSDGVALIAGLQGFLNAGYVVAATDYQGLGTPGVHPYLVGISEGRSTLDAARAARNITEAGAGSQVFTWGHSQGGQASLFAGELAPTYAPDLQVKGVSAAAPAGDLAAIFAADQNSEDGVLLGGWAMNAYAQVYGPSTPSLNLATELTPTGLQSLPTFENLCIPTDDTQLNTIATPLVGNFWANANPGGTPPWNQLLQQNTPGAVKTPAPIFIAQDTADAVVPAANTATLAQQLCAKGDTLNLKSYPGLSHEVIGFDSAPDALAWMQAILAGQPAPTTC